MGASSRTRRGDARVPPIDSRNYGLVAQGASRTAVYHYLLLLNLFIIYYTFDCILRDLRFVSQMLPSLLSAPQIEHFQSPCHTRTTYLRFKSTRYSLPLRLAVLSRIFSVSVLATVTQFKFSRFEKSFLIAHTHRCPCEWPQKMLKLFFAFNLLLPL